MDNLVIQANTIAAGTGTYLSSVSNTTDFYVSEMGVNGCESPRTQVTATVTFGDPVTAEAKVAGSPVTSVCTATPFDLSTLQPGTTNNYTYTWTASPAVGSGITGSASGGTSLSPTIVSVTPTIAGTYVYTVSYTDGVCSGFSTVTVIAAALPTNVTASASSNTFCGSGTFNLSATGNGSGGAILAANMEVYSKQYFRYVYCGTEHYLFYRGNKFIEI